MTTATQLTTRELISLLDVTIPNREPVLIEGEPGVGKTDVIKQVTASHSHSLVLMHPVVHDPTKYSGMPWVSQNGKTLRADFIPFGQLQELISADVPTVAFLDDFGQATPAVQAAAMQLFLAREIDGAKISDFVTFIVATNGRSHRAGVSGILEPVKSRFITLVELVANVTDWRKWAAAAGIRPEVIAFLAHRPQLLSCFKPTADMTNSPSPRQWAAVSRQLKIGVPKQIQLKTICGAVGEGAGTEFTAFLRVWQNMVSPDLALTAPDTAPIPDEPSALYALVTAIADRVQQASMERFGRYLTRVLKAKGEEFAACSMQVATARDPALCNTPAYIDLMSGPLGQLMIGGTI